MERDIYELVGGPPPGRNEPTVSASVVGEWIGLTGNRVNALARDGRLPRETDGSFVLRDTVQAYCDFARKGATGRLSANPDLNEAKLKLAREQADKLAIANAKARGELLDATRVAVEWGGVLTDVRAAVLAIPQRVAAACGLDRAATVALDDEIRRALEAAAEDE